MKNFSFLLLSLLIFSCGRNASMVVAAKTDTILVVCRQGDNLTFIDSAIRTISSKRAFKDTSSLQGIMSKDTTYRLLQAVDTLRDSLHKPLFDANHKARFLFLYSPSIIPDSLTPYIQPITLPLYPRTK